MTPESDDERADRLSVSAGERCAEPSDGTPGGGEARDAADETPSEEEVGRSAAMMIEWASAS